MIHVIPTDDIRPHDESILCWCKPQITEHVVIHHAFGESYGDEREIN